MLEGAQHDLRLGPRVHDDARIRGAYGADDHIDPLTIRAHCHPPQATRFPGLGGRYDPEGSCIDHGDGTASWCSSFPAGQCPLFYAPLIGLGQNATVLGVSTLNAGKYTFYCQPHPGMHGILVVR